MPSRWDFLYNLKPVTLTEHFVEEVSKLLVQDLKEWPLAVTSWTSPQDESRFKPLLEPGASRPDARVYAAAFHLTRLELLREFAQIDDFMRNERWHEFTASRTGVDQMIFLNRYMTEQLLAIAEATEGRIKRPQLIDLLSRVERRLIGSPP